MQLSEVIRKCVGFVYIKTQTGHRAIGTAFFIGKPGHRCFTITARHVITQAAERSTDGIVYVRVNTKARKSVVCEFPVSEWTFHPTDSSADVAVAPNCPTGGDLDTRIIGDSLIASAQFMKDMEVTLGEETCTVGMFSNHVGLEFIEPIVRTGSLASMPQEPVNATLGLTDAYLVECRSIGGLSGSPVFMNLGIMRRIGNEIKTFSASGDMAVGGHLSLLGMAVGHWQVPIGQSAVQAEAINMGIGIVIPAWKIMEAVASRSQVLPAI